MEVNVEKHNMLLAYFDTKYVLIGNEIYKKNKNSIRKLKPTLNKYGYFRIGLTLDCKREHFSLHRVIWHIHHRNPAKEGYVVDHIDGDKKNNSIDNLQHVPIAKNVRKGLSAKLQKSDICLIIDKFKNGKLIDDIANEMSVSSGTVRLILKNQTWKNNRTPVPKLKTGPKRNVFPNEDIMDIRKLYDNDISVKEISLKYPQYNPRSIAKIAYRERHREI